MDIQNIENRVPFREQIKKVSNNKCVFGITVASFLTSFSVFIYLLATPEKIVYNNVGAGKPSFRPTMVPSLAPSWNDVAIKTPTIIFTESPSGYPTMYPSYTMTTGSDVD
jgi:hypothetical protein